MTDKIEYSIPEIHITESTDRKKNREFYAWCMVSGQIHSSRQIISASTWDKFGTEPTYLFAIRHEIVQSLLEFLLKKELI